jgi:hypothetical protein
MWKMLRFIMAEILASIAGVFLEVRQERAIFYFRHKKRV